MSERSGEPLTYARFAAVALPLLVVATIYLLYRDLDRHLGETPRATSSAPASSVAPPPTVSPSAASSAFEMIYRDAVWGKNAAGEGTSGSGSTLAATAQYRTYLEGFMKAHGIRSVVDAGCGDWEFSKAIDWSGIDYKGYDIVESVVAKDKAKYEAANVHFFAANIVTDDLPAADLLISKHVLQHLPTADVQKFMAQLRKYRHVLLTNGVHPVTLSADNVDIPVGGYRPLDPTQPPFSLPGRKELTWWDGIHMHQVVHLTRKDPN